MRRRSERGKTKPAPKEEEEPQEKTVRKSQRHSRRRKKSTSSSEEESVKPNKDVESVTQPLEIQIQDIELPQEPNSATAVTNTESEPSKKPENASNEWKEDNTFWDTTETPKPTPENAGEDKEGSSMWKVQSANGASGGEIQKLKICRQKPTESPEIGETSLRKRLSRGPRDSRSTDESTQDEQEKDTKKSKHRTRTSSRNSPLVSPTVVCDMSEGSPTKIKIINVSHLNTESKGAKPSSEEIVENESKNEQVLEISQASDTLDIALPSEESQIIEAEVSNQIVEEKKEEPVAEKSPATKEDTPKPDDNKPLEVKEKFEEKCTKTSPRKSPSPSPSPVNENAKRQSSESSRNSQDESGGESPSRKPKKQHHGLQSSVQRRPSPSTNPKHESSDSEDDKNKKKEEERQSTDNNETKEMINDKENETENCLPPSKGNAVDDKDDKDDKPPLPRKRRWGSSKSNRSNKKPVLINTDCLKSLIPDAKLVSADELQLSVEEEEGQLDDEEEEDEVVAMVAKEEERERQREQREKEVAKQEEEKRKRQERFAKIAAEQPPPPTPAPRVQQEGGGTRKILLVTEDAKKLARSPSPPRHKPTNVLYITHLVRPFTVQQLKNLLLRTGAIAENGFWIDKIKSKCYVEYQTEDQAVETRHALHGVRWPSSNPKTLVVEFSSKDDLAMAQALTEEPEVPRKSEPLTMVEGWVADQARIKERTKRQTVVREWDVGKPEHPDEALEYEMKMKEKREQERKTRKDKHHRSVSPENEPPARKSRKKEEDAPAKLLDDLFRKTKTSPCIYWLPLTQEQIAVKEEIRRQHMAEHERRMAELKKAELARRERERRSRK